jgi:hypothetical protein
MESQSGIDEPPRDQGGEDAGDDAVDDGDHARG